MTGISSSVGLISGIDYTSLVDQLIEVDRTTKYNLISRTEALEKEEAALTSVATKFITASYIIENLNQKSAWNKCTVTSSNTNLLIANTASKATPTPGIYTLTPTRMASSQQTIAQGVVSKTNALNKTGEITIGPGWSLDKEVNLSDINYGEGFTKGYIRITDGSGTRATIDLRSCTTMDDVIEKINTTQSIDVWAELDGDALKLIDQSGMSASELIVQEVNGGKTAASLGLTTTAVNGEIKGTNLFGLNMNTSLASLNDGNGLYFDTYKEDMIVQLKDGTELKIDFAYRASEDEKKAGAPEIATELTIGDLINTINETEGNNGRFTARISDDGKGLVFEDTTVKNVKASGSLYTDEHGNETYVWELPDEYDENDYEVDNDGFVVDKSTGDRVELEASTVIKQHAQNGTVPILKMLGLTDRYSTADLPTSESGVFHTRDLVGSMDSPLMASLNGGYGMSNATEGQVLVQDRNGNRALLNFTTDELKQMNKGTLNDAMAILNSKLATADRVDADGNVIAGEEGMGVGLKLEINSNRTGLAIVDTSGGSGNILFEDVRVTTTTTDDEGEEVTTTTNPKIASTFGLDGINAKSNTANGKSLNLQTVNYTTSLADLNGGKGVVVTSGRMLITDSAGNSMTVTTSSSSHQTVGDIINAINDATRSTSSTTPRVLARINDAGDGIVIEDLAGGEGTFSIVDGNKSSKIVSGLNMTGEAKVNEETGRQYIDGSQTVAIEIEANDTLETIRDKINEVGGNYTASIIADGTGNPYRLVISGGSTGAAGAMNIDLSALGLTTENMTEAQDARLVYGDANSSTGVVLTSKTNSFAGVIPGIDITIAGVSDTPITVTSERTSTDIKAALKTFVENYNTYREELNVQTYYDTSLNVGNPLHANRVAQAFDRDVTNVINKQVYGIDGINSLRSIGITIRSSVDDEGINKSTGKLVFDEKVFDALWESNKEGLEEFFFKEQTILDPDGGVDDDGNPKTVTQKVGWCQSFVTVSDSLVGTGSGMVYKALETLDTKITANYERAEYLEARLQVKRTQMLNKFYQMEQAMAKMSNDLSTVSSISSNWASNMSTTGTY